MQGRSKQCLTQKMVAPFPGEVTKALKFVYFLFLECAFNYYYIMGAHASLIYFLLGPCIRDIPQTDIKGSQCQKFLDYVRSFSADYESYCLNRYFQHFLKD